MQTNDVAIPNFMPRSEVSRNVAIARLLIGLLQGGILYFLYHAGKHFLWPATEPALFVPLVMVFSLIPVMVIAALGHLKPASLLSWTLIFSILLAGLAFHDVWRSSGLDLELNPADLSKKTTFPSVLLLIFSMAAMFIAHSLLLASAQDQRRIASYPTHFEIAWKLLIQIKFSVLFVGALWLVLQLGAELFMLVKLSLLRDLLKESWFAIPVTAFAFSCAMHITDVRPAIVRGIRSLLLVLMSWILPITVLLVGGFLLSLPGTGLQALWATRHATAVLLGSAAALVVFINATFQNGEVDDGVAWILRISARIAALLLLPITLIGTYALYLRVEEYGWTSDRIIAAACLLVALSYTLGYVWAGVQIKSWLKQIAQVNVFTAFMILGVLFALFTPIADPARISVAHQLARLAAGKVSAEKFDYAYLRFEGGRYGREALEQMQNRTDGNDAKIMREKSRHVLQIKNRWERDKINPEKIDLRAQLEVWPKGADLPASFLQQDWSTLEARASIPCIDKTTGICDAYLIDVTHDAEAEILLIGRERNIGSVILAKNAQGKWASLGSLSAEVAGCERLRQQLQAGNFHAIKAPVDSIQIGEQHITVYQARQERVPCTNAVK